MKVKTALAALAIAIILVLFSGIFIWKYKDIKTWLDNRYKPEVKAEDELPIVTDENTEYEPPTIESRSDLIKSREAWEAAYSKGTISRSIYMQLFNQYVAYYQEMESSEHDKYITLLRTYGPQF